jgi:hypothetical protein
VKATKAPLWRPALSLPTPVRLLGWGAATIGLACVGFVTWFWLSHASGQTPGDTHNYILAGLRLNVGHPLYSYGIGDEHAAMSSPDSTVALFSPPLIGVVFRAVVLLPGNGQYIWWPTMDVLELAAVIALLRREPLVTGLALIPLSLAVGMAMQVGNADCLVLPGLLLAWLWLREGHDSRAAVLIGLLASLKLAPAIFVWWLYVTGRRRAAAIAVGCGIVLGFVAMLGSEPLIFLRFYEVTVANASAPASDLGPLGLARVLGLPPVLIAWLPRAILLGGVGAMWAARRRPGVSWAIGALLMWWVSPVVSLHTPALALVAIAPLAWPMARDRIDVGPATTRTRSGNADEDPSGESIEGVGAMKPGRRGLLGGAGVRARLDAGRMRRLPDLDLRQPR